MIEIFGFCDHDGIQSVETVPCALYTGESRAHRFVIRGKDSGELYDLSGIVTAKFTPAKGNTLDLTGEIEDGAACVTLTAACYTVPGAFTFHVYLAADGANVCIYSARGTVIRAGTDTEADGGTVISELTQLLTAAGSLDTRVTALEEAVDGSLTLGAGTANEVTLTAAQLTQLLALLS